MTASTTTGLRRARTSAPLRWQQAYVASLVGLDAVVAVGAICLAWAIDGGERHGYVAGLSIGWVLLTAVAVWLAGLAMVGGYEMRYLGGGSEEYKRVGEAAIRLTAVGALLIYATRTDISRSFILAALPLVWALTVLARWSARKVLHRSRYAGRCLHKVLAVGPHELVEQLVARIGHEPYAGYDVVASVYWDRDDELRGDRVTLALEEWNVDTVAVAGGLTPDELRALSWQLETVGAELVVAPGLTNVAGPRVHVRPVAGLPLLHLERPDFRGGWRFLKVALDRVTAAVLIATLSPVLLAIAVVIRRTSPGPAFFKQQRLGLDGRPFTIYKFRTMVDGADLGFIDLVAASGSSHGMFVKDPDDPRITPVGRWLRRYSLDELPQLINVLRGEMSLVGPRPLPLAAAQDARDAQRRLLARPGMTGLWQISGRSDLSFEEALRMDLYYVENWSFVFDLMIIWKTLFVIARPNGAY